MSANEPKLTGALIYSMVRRVLDHRSEERTMANILILEDEEQVRVLADSFLQGVGNKTLSAATIEQALALIEGEEPVDLLFRGSENSG